MRFMHQDITVLHKELKLFCHFKNRVHITYNIIIYFLYFKNTLSFRNLLNFFCCQLHNFETREDFYL